MKKCLFACALLLSLLMALAGCDDYAGAREEDKNPADVNLVTYSNNDDGSISAYTLSVALDTQTLKLSPEPLFTVPGGLDWLDQVYPVALSANALVLPKPPTGDTAIPYVVAQKGTLYYQDYTLIYDETEATATVERAGRTVAVLPMSIEGDFVTPQAFFVNEDGQIAVLANTNGSTYDLVYPVTLLYSKTDDGFALEKSASFQTIFEENDFSKVNQPTYVPALSNVYGNGSTGTFLWNETTNIVALDPVQGTAQVLLDDKRIAEDLPEMDTSRDFMEFFSDVGYQNGVYMSSFPNYNSTFGTNVAFYSSDGTFLGHILCTEIAMTLTNGKGEETARIDKDSLCGLLYTPQSPLT